MQTTIVALGKGQSSARTRDARALQEAACRAWEESTANRYLLGEFAPVDHECDVRDLAVQGELPERLRGVYVRNGPNPANPVAADYHLLDGDGMVHAFWISGGRVNRYRSHWIRTEGMLRELRAGRALHASLTTRGLLLRAIRQGLRPEKKSGRRWLFCSAE